MFISFFFYYDEIDFYFIDMLILSVDCGFDNVIIYLIYRVISRMLFIFDIVGIISRVF